ncbi:MAG TPA: sulfite exporter TauE/SafE family protein [Opitutaceae bacterium]|nr:sulfite exporter TauE/SafE family protein [Opitutaceae bacterium]
MTWTEALWLILAAAAGGAVNAVAGGGTLITFPALLLARTGTVVANATSTLALVLGTGGGMFGYRRQLAAARPWLVRFVPVSMLGGLIGAILLTLSGEALFSHLVPFLLLFATVVFVAQGTFRRFAGFEAGAGAALHPHSREIGVAVLYQFLVAVYGGYFGAGIGILMLASLGFIGLTDIHEMNALKTVLGSLINLVAAVYFIFAGLINWPKAGVMTIGAVAGYFLGAHFAQRIPQKRVRQIITAIGFLISGVLFYRQFLR